MIFSYRLFRNFSFCYCYILIAQLLFELTFDFPVHQHLDRELQVLRGHLEQLKLPWHSLPGTLHRYHRSWSLHLYNIHDWFTSIHTVSTLSTYFLASKDSHSGNRKHWCLSHNNFWNHLWRKIFHSTFWIHFWIKWVLQSVLSGNVLNRVNTLRRIYKLEL